MAPYLGRSATSRTQWRRLGVHVAAVPMAASGGCRRDGGELVVLVRESDDPRRQRFTVAHEIGHLLIEDVRRHVPLSRADEERLCNEFAAALLVPGEALAADLKDIGRVGADDVVRLGNRFGVTLQPLLIALGSHLDVTEVLLVARYGGHPKRPLELAYRFHASVATSVFLPRKQRLTSVGLAALDGFARGLEHGSSGRDQVMVELRRDAPPHSGSGHGEVSWDARLMPNGLLIASLDASSLQETWGSEFAVCAA